MKFFPIESTSTLSWNSTRHMLENWLERPVWLSVESDYGSRQQRAMAQVSIELILRTYQTRKRAHSIAVTAEW